MSRFQTPCAPLDWKNEFLYFLAQMDGEIHRETDDSKRLKLVKYQTIIAIGGYFGPRAKEFLTMTWNDIIDKKEGEIFEYKTEKKRKVAFHPNFISYANRNFKIINPLNIHHLILHKTSSPLERIATPQFNRAFKNYLVKFNIKTENPSSHTLRKTFMERLWNRLGADSKAYLTVAKHMGYQDVSQVQDYLGHTRQQIKEAVITL